MLSSAAESQGGGLLLEIGVDHVAFGALAVLSHHTEDFVISNRADCFIEQLEFEAWRHHDAHGCVGHVSLVQRAGAPVVGLLLGPQINGHNSGYAGALVVLVDSAGSELVRVADVLLRLAECLEHLAGHLLEGLVANLGRLVFDGVASYPLDVVLEVARLAFTKVGLDVEDLFVESLNLLAKINRATMQGVNLVLLMLDVGGSLVLLALALLGEAGGEEGCDSNV